MLGAKIVLTNATHFIADRARFALADMTFDCMVLTKHMRTLCAVDGVLLAKGFLADRATFATGHTADAITL